MKGNIAIFVPHLGCPNQCSFCNQKTITATVKEPTKEFVKNECEKALMINKGKDIRCEIAFFGGSFTAIERNYMISLLEAASSFLSNDLFNGIRISTRPDAINDEILEILKRYGVTAIELGAQSLCDDVLQLNKRGHTVDDVIKASYKIKEKGFSLGLQMMTGLYGDTDDNAVKTAEKIIEINPDTVRIYPTVVLKDTMLEKLMLSGEYNPKNAYESVSLCAKLMEMFNLAGIKVIRVGLHSEHSIEENMIGGAYHPSFRELCDNEIYYNRIIKLIENNHIKKGNIVIYTNPKMLSKIIGQRKNNINKLMNNGYIAKVIPDIMIPNDEFSLIQGEEGAN